MLEVRKPIRGRLEQFELRSRVLEGNALGDPHRRPVTVIDYRVDVSLPWLYRKLM